MTENVHNIRHGAGAFGFNGSSNSFSGNDYRRISRLAPGEMRRTNVRQAVVALDFSRDLSGFRQFSLILIPICRNMD